MYQLILFIFLYALALFPVSGQPKYEIRATWLTTLGGMDWPRTKAGSATGIQRQKKESQQFVFAGRQMQFPILKPNTAGAVINLQITVGENRTFLILRLNVTHSAQRNAHTRQQFFHGKGFGQIIVSPGVQGFNFIAVFTAGADYNDRHAAPRTKGLVL